MQPTKTNGSLPGVFPLAFSRVDSNGVIGGQDLLASSSSIAIFADHRPPLKVNVPSLHKGQTVTVVCTLWCGFDVSLVSEWCNPFIDHTSV